MVNGYPVCQGTRYQNSSMTTKATRGNPVEQFDQFVLGNYPKAPLTLVRGQGTEVWDDTGRRFLDFTSGIAVNTLGHADPAWTARMKAQLDELVHVSNLFRNPPQGELAAHLVRKIAPGKVFFCNSGAEANEGLLKLSRLFGHQKTGHEGRAYKVVVFENGFHGRTFGAMSATPQAKIQKGFAPLVPGFVTARFNDLDSVRDVLDEETAAILIEPIQGEGGVHVADDDFLRGLRELCHERDLLLLADEVQCGIGRTGQYFAFQHAGITPDAVSLAKGLGGGFPVGAMWVADAHASLFQPGSHGTTYGGGPLAATAALAVLEAIEERKLLAAAEERGEQLAEGLQQLISQFPQHLQSVRGRGLLRAVAVSGDPLAIVTACRNAGLLVPRAGTDAVRFLPPLTVTAAEIDEALERTREALG